MMTHPTIDSLPAGCDTVRIIKRFGSCTTSSMMMMDSNGFHHTKEELVAFVNQHLEEAARDNASCALVEFGRDRMRRFEYSVEVLSEVKFDLH